MPAVLLSRITTRTTNKKNIHPCFYLLSRQISSRKVELDSWKYQHQVLLVENQLDTIFVNLYLHTTPLVLDKKLMGANSENLLNLSKKKQALIVVQLAMIMQYGTPIIGI